MDWVAIPGGLVTLVEPHIDHSYLGHKGDTRTFDVLPFSIGKYPVTNAQFATFVTDKGYMTERWWTPIGWLWKTVKRKVEPRYWYDDQWNAPDHPIVGVSWYEAVAFCAWLSAQTGEHVHLPTEQQWQRAAQGDDGREYPWGSLWHGSRCNSSMIYGENTTSVTRFEGIGDSPYGVVDMAGNVWEWCLNEYESGSTQLDGQAVRVLRGGSWDDSIGALQTTYRTHYSPDLVYVTIGFRCAKSL